MSTEVYRDAWGIPHLRADSAGELAFAQGRNAARDRAWQIEVERHRSQGTTAAFLGAGAVAWDRFARQARLDDTARRCFRNLDADTRAWVCAYVDGVNAGLAEGARRAPEFAATGLAPGVWQPWTPLGVWLATHILFAGFPTKLWREEVVRRLGPEAVGLFATDGPVSSGSNGWLVTGDRTATGAPVIAGDPHRFIEAPGVYQQIRLACPEYDVVGLAVPGVPGIAHFGHTGTVAWAITNAMADYQDLYRERLRRDGTRVRALGPDGWRPASAHTETIEVAGADPVEVEVVETERGPVVIGGPDSTAAISLRYPPRVSGELGFGALPALLRARGVADVDRAFDQWAEPVNVVQAADTEGGLLHRVAGRVPLRHHDNRLRVVPAWEPGHEWRGLHEPMPREPVDGMAVMANQRGLAEPLGVEFAPPYRAERIRHLLAQSEDWSAAGMAAVHTDTHLGPARLLLGLVAEAEGLSAAGVRLRDRLLRWDRRMAADSTDATAYAAVRTAVVRRLAAHPALAGLTELTRPAEPAGPTTAADPAAVADPTATADPAAPADLTGPAGPTDYPEVFLPWLALVPRVAFALDSLLTTDLLPGLDAAEVVRAAVEEVAAAAEDHVPWAEVHRLAPWQALPDPAPELRPGLPGDHDCVLSTTSVPGVTDHCVRGPAARYAWDLARREDSLWVVPFGASGVPGDPHHRDQLPLWLRGELVPVVTDWNRLTKEERHVH
ncbi:penicillin acylase family protein [Streptomyces sp. XD-27]|uniref:penicillin acylase family protein n=1 Tax=Streptomyces sp. XD-27 TaxID=3062779 RepID=UPI0026F41BCD|nr:penicillin acylase family protein [Streptomyces sp. XD-27]WKX69102.1 penicillin acylase family protein [Streptomyces sp. XD-27]